jgi:hypothetical protein
VDNFIVRFKVAKVVNGVFDFDEVHMLIHSPSQSGVRDADQRFVLTLTADPTGLCLGSDPARPWTARSLAKP